MLMGEKIGSGYMLVMLPNPQDMNMLIHVMAEKQGINWFSRQ